MTPDEPFSGRTDHPRPYQFWQFLVSPAHQPAGNIALRLLLITAISVFVAEALIMLFLDAIGTLDLWSTVLLDASLILLCTLPALYMWLYRPMMRHIAARDKAQESVRESEHRLSSHLQNTPIGVIEWNLDLEVAEWNAAAEKIFGYSKDEAMGKSATELIIPESVWGSVSEVWDKLKKNTGGYCSINENVTKDGRTIVCEWTNTPLLDDSGKVYGVAALVQDITDARKAEEELTVSEERFRTQMIQSPHVMEIYDLEGLQIEVNQAYEKLWGFPADTTVNKFNVLQSKEVEETGLLDFVKRAYAGEAVTLPEYEFDPTGATESGGPGRVRWLSTKIYPLKDSSDNVTNIVITHDDITDRKQAEKALAQSEERFRKLFQEAPLSYQSLDENGNFLEVNETWCQTLGYTREEVIGRNFAEFIDPAFKDVFERCFPMFRDAGSIDGVEHTMVKKDGSTIIAAFNGRIGYNDDNSFKQTHCIFADVTESKRAAEAFHKSEERFRRLFEHSNDPIFVHSLEGQILDVNNRACEMLGYSHDQLLSMTVPSLHPEEEIDKCAAAMRITEQEGSTVFESSFIAADGSVHDVSISSRIVDSKQGIVQGLVRDITETKRLQKLESRAQRLETAGQIAGQVAHDFNNLLAPLMAYPEFIREGLPDDHPGLAYLDAIDYSAKKMADINQQLLSLGRRGHYNQEVLKLNKIVREAVKELQPLPDQISFKVDLEEDLMNVRGGGAQIYRVITNLLRNAIDALQGIGRVTIKTENYYVDDVSVAYGRVPKGEYIKLSVTDTGGGIPSEIVQNIFDPFFTSKTTDKKRGSGLGLSVVDAVVKDHGGHIDLSTKIGHGTSFYIYLPMTREPLLVARTEEIVGGCEKVLIVDDDSVQRDVSRQLLNRLGYDVSLVDSGEAAISFLEENPQDLLVLDMVMPPGIDGAETYRRILQINPSQKAIIVSGFSETERVDEAQRLGAGAFVKKPLTGEVLGAAVRTELDRQAVSSPS